MASPRYRKDLLFCIAVIVACRVPASHSAAELATARSAIATQIARSVQATRDKNIDALLAVQTPDFILQNDTAGDEHGERLTQGQLRANLLRDWSVIAENR